MEVNGWFNLLEKPLSGNAALIVFSVVVLIGILLCLLGRKLVKPVMCLGFVVAGGSLACAIAYGRFVQPILIGWVIGGCLVGLIVGWLLFRMWMGVALAMVLAAIVPIAALAFEHKMPPIPSLGQQTVIDFRKALEADANLRQTADDDRLPLDIGRNVQQVIEGLYQPVLDWWKELTPGMRSLTVLGAIAGGMLGLFIGLIGPRFTASLLSSMLGAGMILAGLAHLGLPQIEPYLPHVRWLQLLVLGLITAAGVIVQWTIFRRKADK